MKVSLNTIKQFIDFELPPIDELVKTINAQLGVIEEVIDLGGKYKDAVIVKIVSAEQHPDADRLRVCLIDDGGVNTAVPRSEDGFVQVVCGAPNARAGIFAVWLPPEATVPSTAQDSEPFVLSAREMRGVLSQGMLAAGDELAINSDHDGIIEIDPEQWRPYDVAITPGASFAAAYGLDDVILDIENKMFTHRPDLFGQLGVAREIAGILGHQFVSPDWYTEPPTFAAVENLSLETFNDAGEKVPRAMFVVMENVEIAPSPLWLQCALVAMGSKAINNIVDITNYVMLLTAQPTHAYDYDKIRGQKIGARMAQAGEKITLLNGKDYELSADDIVIADGEGPIGLGGIMGGGDSEVDANTKRIVLEVASFDMYAVRKSAMRHGVFTDALTRFNKGQSPLQNDRIINLLMASIQDVSPAKQASDVKDSGIDQNMTEPVVASASFINERLGLNLTSDEVFELLRHVEMRISEEDGSSDPDADTSTYPVLVVAPPFWRTDIEQSEDIVEEVGRLYGFDKLPRELPKRTMMPTRKNPLRETKQQVREIMKRAGANEVLTYSFVHEKVLKNAEQDVSQAFRLSNALSPDLQYYRLSVLPSLLDKVHMNIRAGHNEFALFEAGKAHNKEHHYDDDEGLPSAMEMIDGVYASKKAIDGAAFYKVRNMMDALAKGLGLSFVYKTIEEPLDYPLTAPFDLSRSALIETVNGEFIGMIGEVKQSVHKNFKLPDTVAAFSLDAKAIMSAKQSVSYRPLSRYPGITQDVSLIVPADTVFSQILNRANAVLDNLDDRWQYEVAPVSVYQSDDTLDEKTVTLRISVANLDRTLKEDEVSALIKKIQVGNNETAAA